MTKRMIVLLTLTNCFFQTFVCSQNVGIGTSSPHTNAILDLTSTNKGFLVPRLTATQRVALADMAGMIVYDSTLKRLYYSHGTGWQYLTDNSFWSTNGTGIYNLTQVGIGTVSPHASARLQVSSTTQGFLPPSMTSTQRNNIIAPADGLMVYDNTADRLYQYQNGAWKFLINNDHWVLNGSNLYNAAVNVGIGNAAPTERLHVSGNILADGDLVTYGEIKMNNTEGILQFQDAGVDKTFVQLSGQNLRMGTNSGNTTGNVIFRLNGSDKVYINPEGDLYLFGGGDLQMVSGSKLFRGNSGLTDLLPVAYGRVSSSGTLLSGTQNVTASRVSEGIYHLHCTDFTSSTTIIITMNTYAGGYYAYPNVAYHSTNVYRVPFIHTSTGTHLDAGFSFVAYR